MGARCCAAAAGALPAPASLLFLLQNRLNSCAGDLQALGIKPKAPKQLKPAQLDKLDMQKLLQGSGEYLPYGNTTSSCCCQRSCGQVRPGRMLVQAGARGFLDACLSAASSGPLCARYCTEWAGISRGWACSPPVSVPSWLARLFALQAPGSVALHRRITLLCL